LASTVLIPVLIPVLLLSAVLAAPSPGPTVLLYGADPRQARDLAIGSALERGWRLASVTLDGVTFEQTLEGPEAEDGSGPVRIIRVSARFNLEGGGVRVQLSAQEVEQPGRPEEWTADVTDRYGLNLANALSSLRARWDARIPSQSPSPTPWSDAAAPSPLPSPPATGRGESLGAVGTWAYYAEDYAQSRGCVLTDAGARLESAGSDWERHRVPCQDGRLLHVYCRFGDCTAAPP
jgi:hypothetical protein